MKSSQEIVLEPHFNESEPYELCVVPFYLKNDTPCLAYESAFLENLCAPIIDTKDFKGQLKETSWIYPGNSKKRLLLLGLGENEALTVESLRVAYSQVPKFSREKKISKAHVLMPSETSSLSEAELVEGIVEGLKLANYSWDTLKTVDAPTQLLESIVLIGASEKQRSLINEIELVSNHVYDARDLVNGNADLITPAYLAEVALEMEASYPNVKVHLVKGDALVDEGLPMLAAVARASMHEPYLIVIDYQGGEKESPYTALVGKGVTYDTGGLSIKSTKGMLTMREDMAGAAAVLGAMGAAVESQLAQNIVCVIPTTENGIGAFSYKPGDVYQTHKGLTVEITNTDAEGRLILADALSYVTENYSLDAVVDVATLTGAVVRVLGNHISGLFSNNSELQQKICDAATKTNESVWPLPLCSHLKKRLKSKCADLKNCDRAEGGAMFAALFLQEFVGKTKWAHLDIAGVAYQESGFDYVPELGTGFGVRLLYQFLKSLNH